MKIRYMLLAGGIDKKGIVRELTGILKKYDFNIEDSSMAMLRRTFSVIMLLSHDGRPDEEGFRKQLAVFSKKFRMTAGISRIAEAEIREYSAGGTTYDISISGADKPGIVNAVAEELFRAGANIIGLETKSSERVTPHAYYMFLEAAVPAPLKPERLKKNLEKLGKKNGVHVSISEVAKEIL